MGRNGTQFISSTWPAKQRPNRLKGPLLPALGLALFLGFATRGADGIGDRRSRRCDHSSLLLILDRFLPPSLRLLFFRSINYQRLQWLLPLPLSSITPSSKADTPRSKGAFVWEFPLSFSLCCSKSFPLLLLKWLSLFLSTLPVNTEVGKITCLQLVA